MCIYVRTAASFVNDYVFISSGKHHDCFFLFYLFSKVVLIAMTESHYQICDDKSCRQGYSSPQPFFFQKFFMLIIV